MQLAAMLLAALRRAALLMQSPSDAAASPVSDAMSIEESFPRRALAATRRARRREWVLVSHRRSWTP